MALGRMNPAYCSSPLVSEYFGYVYFSNPSAVTTTTVINTPAKNALTTAANGATIGQQMVIGPDARMPVVLYPTTSYHPAVASNGNSAAIVMLDCRQQNADIIYASAAYVPPINSTPGSLPPVSQAGAANLLAIDNVNKFIYFYVTSVSGAGLPPVAGSSIQFNVSFKDTVAI